MIKARGFNLIFENSYIINLYLMVNWFPNKSNNKKTEELNCLAIFNSQTTLNILNSFLMHGRKRPYSRNFEKSSKSYY